MKRENRRADFSLRRVQRLSFLEHFREQSPGRRNGIDNFVNGSEYIHSLVENSGKVIICPPIFLMFRSDFPPFMGQELTLRSQQQTRGGAAGFRFRSRTSSIGLPRGQEACTDGGRRGTYLCTPSTLRAE